jgi:hypothetical protein
VSSEIGGELIELRFPEAAVRFNPVRRVSQRRGDDAAVARAAVLADIGESRALQHAHVFGNGGERHVEARRELPDRLVALGEPREDGAPGGIGERAERGVEDSAGMVNHVV